jgi:hypothetical protein
MSFANKTVSLQTSLLLSGILLSLAVPASAAGETAAKTATSSKDVEVFVETDPATFVFKGHAAHFRLAPGGTPGWVFGVGLYGQELPSFVADLHPENKGKDFNLAIKEAYATFVDYHFSGRPEGWFVGAQLALQRFEVSGPEVAAPTEVGSLLIMPRGGYLWHPVQDSGFYLLPWGGIGPSIELYRSSEDADSYHHLPILAFGSLHVGWKF